MGATAIQIAKFCLKYMLKNITMINIKFPSGKKRIFCINEFEKFGDEWEHRTDNIILNISEPHKSFTYETNSWGEITNKEYINYNIQ